METLSEHVSDEVRRFIAHEYLEGDDEDLGSESPLLEWGILDSVAMVSLVSFLEDRFGIRVTQSDITPDNFRNLDRIASMVIHRSTHPPAVDEDAHEVEAFELAQLEDFGATRVWTRVESGALIHSVHMPGPAPTIWLLPEPGEASTSYGDMQRALEGIYRSVAVDLPGFGISEVGRTLPTFWDHADALQEAIEASGDDPIVLVGHGFSAALALELSQRQPERVKAVVALGYGDLSEPTTLLAAPDAATYLAKRRHPSTNLSESTLAAVLRRIEAPAYRAFLDDKACRHLPRLLDQVTTPTLWLGGLADELVDPATTEAAAARMSCAATKWLARSGHGFPIERPDETVTLISTYLAEQAKEAKHAK